MNKNRTQFLVTSGSVFKSNIELGQLEVIKYPKVSCHINLQKYEMAKYDLKSVLPLYTYVA